MTPGPFSVFAIAQQLLRGRREDRAGHQVIGLEIVAEEEVVDADLDEAGLTVIGPRALVALPHAEPQALPPASARSVFHRRHQPARDAAPVMSGVDVEAPEL